MKVSINDAKDMEFEIGESLEVQIPTSSSSFTHDLPNDQFKDKGENDFKIPLERKMIVSEYMDAKLLIKQNLDIFCEG